MSSAPVFVSDPGAFASTREMALAVGERLGAYFTTYWTTGDGRAGRLPVIGRELVRRTLPAQLAGRARAMGTAREFLRVGLGRLGVSAFDYALVWARNLEFDNAVAREVAADATVIAQFGAALGTLERVRARGIGVLDYPIANLRRVAELMREEAALWPDLADSVTGLQSLLPNAAHAERMDREVDAAACVIVGSRFAADSFDEKGMRERVRIVSYGVDTAQFVPGPPAAANGPLRVLFAGQITLRKGVPYLLEAFRALDSRRFTLTLAGRVIGDGRGLASHAGGFHQLTGLRRRDMPAVYRQHDVFVLPSIAEGSAYVVYEAMASGLPVIVTPNTGADLVRDGVDGFVVPIRSPEAIAARLEALAGDRETVARIGESARARSLEFDWARFREEFADVLAEVEGER